MANENTYLNGLIIKAPNENAPDYVKAKISIKREELIASLQAMTGDWINLDVKVAQSGKWHAPVDNWKPNGERQAAPARQAPAEPDDLQFQDDDIPF